MKCKICGSESGSYPLCRTCYAKREAGEIIKCVKCGSWHYAGSPCHCEEGFQASRTSSEAELPFLYEAKPSLVTKTETAYLNCIKSFLPDWPEPGSGQSGLIYQKNGWGQISE